MPEKVIAPETEQPWPGPPVAIIRIAGAHEIIVTAPPGIEVRINQQ